MTCVAALSAVLSLAAPALASAMTFSPPDPVVGDTVGRFDRTERVRHGVPGGLPLGGHQGLGTAPSRPNNSTNPQHPDLSAGGYWVTFEQRCSDGHNPAQDSGQFTVGPGLGGSISVNPDPPVVNQQATLSAAATGGNPGYSFSWDLNNDGTFGDSTSRTPSYTFTTTGPHTVEVQITDNQGTTNSQNPTHTTTVTRTINVVAPTPTSRLRRRRRRAPRPSRLGSRSSRPTAVSPPDGRNQWTTTSAITVNGISLPDYGQTFTITDSATGVPGHFTAPNSTLKSTGSPSSRATSTGHCPTAAPATRRGALPRHSGGAEDRGLPRERSGRARLRAARKDSSFYSSFGFNLELPATFTAGPDPSFGSVSAGASVTVDDQGVHYNGLRVEAHDVWLGKLKVASVCFSYIPANGTTTAPCDPPSFGPSNNLTPKLNGDEPFLACNSDPTTNRWDGSAVLELPSKLQLGAYGGVADGQITKLGGSIGGLEKRVPIAAGVYLDHVAFGLCLSPPPFKIRANIGANFLGSNHLVSVDGSFTYIDEYGFTPWSLAVDGSLKVAESRSGRRTSASPPRSSSPSAFRRE